jgi:hypothetical protein
MRLGGGRPLDGALRGRMEHALGADLEGVRVHTDAHAARLADEQDAHAFTVGDDIAFGEGAYRPGTLAGDLLIAHELAHTVQQRQGGGVAGDHEGEADRAAIGALVGRRASLSGRGVGLQRCSKSKSQSTAQGEPALLTSFAGSFAAAAALIRGRSTAVAFIREADTAGVTFGGFSEDGPAASAWPYTSGTAVYVPRAQATDAELAARSFIFELNNAMRSSAFADLAKKAHEGTLGATQFAHDCVAQEVEGMMRLAQVYAGYRDSLSNTDRARLDSQYYWGEYQEVQSNKKTKEQIIQDVLHRVYPSGADAGKTVEQHYIDEYNRVK